MKVLGLKVQDDFYFKVKEIADKKGITISDLLYQYINKIILPVQTYDYDKIKEILDIVREKGIAVKEHINYTAGTVWQQDSFEFLDFWIRRETVIGNTKNSIHPLGFSRYYLQKYGENTYYKRLDELKDYLLKL